LPRIIKTSNSVNAQDGKVANNKKFAATTKYVSLTVRTADYFRCRKRQAFESCRYETLSE